MNCGIEFYIGYSPERINPGDEAHALTKITKIVAGLDKLFCKQKPLLKIAYAIAKGTGIIFTGTIIGMLLKKFIYNIGV